MSAKTILTPEERIKLLEIQNKLLNDENTRLVQLLLKYQALLKNITIQN